MPSSTLLLSEFFKLDSLNVALLPILKEQALHENKDQYTFHVYNRPDDDKEPTLLGGGTEETLNECIIEGLRILERSGRNLWNFIGNQDDWNEFIYDWVIDDATREKYPWDDHWEVEPAHLPPIPIDLARVACEICDIIMDESESFFIYIDSDDEPDDSEWTGSDDSDWSDSDEWSDSDGSDWSGSDLEDE